MRDEKILGTESRSKRLENMKAEVCKQKFDKRVNKSDLLW